MYKIIASQQKLLKKLISWERQVK